MKNRNIFAAILGALLLAGCSEANKGSIKIVSIKPEPTVILTVGQKVDMEVVAEYTLNKNSGRASIVVQSKEGTSLDTITDSVNLQKGSGKVTLHQNFVVPDTPEVHVSVPLFAGGSSQTGIVDARTYNIAKKK